MLVFLRKMTADPAALGPADARAVLDAGVSREAFVDALHVAFLFNVYDRLADTMGWHVPDEASGYYDTAAKRLLSRGYE
jgi:hypothetical protein